MTALTPAQVREHARALIERYGANVPRGFIRDTLHRIGPAFDNEGQFDHWVQQIADAIRTARITVDWDEEGSA